jgi:hypothetical protein
MVVADRGIASPMLIRLIQQHGWDYLVRVTADTTMRVPEQPDQVVRLGQVLTEPGRVVVHLTGWVFQRPRQVWASVLIRRQPGYKEAWLLVSNLALGASWPTCTHAACRSRRCSEIPRVGASSGSSVACCVQNAPNACCSASCWPSGVPSCSAKH